MSATKGYRDYPAGSYERGENLRTLGWQPRQGERVWIQGLVYDPVSSEGGFPGVCLWWEPRAGIRTYGVMHADPVHDRYSTVTFRVDQLLPRFEHLEEDLDIEEMKSRGALSYYSQEENPNVQV